MEKQWNVKLVTSKAVKKEEAKTIFKTGWHPSPDKKFFSGSVFVNTKHFFHGQNMNKGSTTSKPEERKEEERSG